MNDEGNFINYKGVVQEPIKDYTLYKEKFNILMQPELNDLEKQALNNGLRLETKEVRTAIIKKLNEVIAAAETMTIIGNPKSLRL